MSQRLTEVRIVPATVEHAESFRECLDCVARERKWLAITEAFPLEATREFLAKGLAEGTSAFFAVKGERVVGWADCHWEGKETMRHRRLLGMGVHVDFRGQGLGRRLLEAVIADAKRKGVIRIDLGVYVSNTAAIALYHKLGFVDEGRVEKSYYYEGRFDDTIRMGLIFPENIPRAATP